jgi:hypothetical protein
MDLSKETFALLPLSSRRPPTPPPREDDDKEEDDGEEPLRYNNIQKLHTQPSALRLQLEVYQDRHTRPYPSRACECRSSDEPLPAGRDTTDRGFLGVE